MSSNLVNNKISPTIENSSPHEIGEAAISQVKSPAGTLLQLEKHQITGFVEGSICPFCKNQNIIFRSWRKDYLCGHCFEVFKVVDGNVHHMGNQKDIE